MAAVTGASGLQLSVSLAVLGAAVVHATWNAIAHGIKDRLVGFTLLGVGGGLCAAPPAVLAPFPDARSWPYLTASVGLHIGYDLMLMRSYRFGDFNQVYPLARGTSPLVVTLLAMVFVGEYPSLPQLVGVLSVTAGMGSLILVGGRPGKADRTAIAAALGTGLIIAAYTAVDGVGVRHSGSPAGYTGWLLLLQSPAVPIAAFALRGRELFAQARPVLAAGMTGGALMVVAYGLVLWAQTRGALAPIAASRETSIIFGAIIGAVVFHEGFGRARVVATVFVAAGIVLLNVP
ncbi:EamA family transporter [Actinomadura sp. SCN-SB]|uniref:EamA family transporter n=1 Tax=Actinomadura sp. SCN-SB TaxID=3373092 RepID=UPI003751C79B